MNQLKTKIDVRQRKKLMNVDEKSSIVMIICFNERKYSLSEEGYSTTDEGECNVLVVPAEKARELLKNGALEGDKKIEICDQDEEICMEDIRKNLFRITKSCKFS